jgi:FkbM family methyltransferase
MLTYALAPALKYAPDWWRWRAYSRLRGDPYQEDGYLGVMRRQRLYPHGYEIELALDNWMERYAYFSRNYYDPTTMVTLQRLLRAGDFFLDVGANIGMVSLVAAKIVGETGRVIAFEPNVRLAERLERSLKSNKIGNVKVCRLALGDDNSSGYLDVNAQHGTGSLRTGVGEVVPIRRGAEFVGDIPNSARTFVKIDVEGYEQHVLRGFGPFLSRPMTAFFMEVTDSWLRDLGGSASSLFEDMNARGYAAYLPAMDWRSRFSFESISGPISGHQYDVLFIRPQDNWFSA